MLYGWNVRYDFTESDLDISTKQLKLFLDLYQDVAFKPLRCMVGELNYGGRVTDEWDLRMLQCTLEDLFCEQILDDTYKLDAAGVYRAPPIESGLDSYHIYIQRLPQEDSSDLFGLHPNVNGITAARESQDLLATVLSLQPQTNDAGSGHSQNDVVGKLGQNIASNLPANFDLEYAMQNYPPKYGDSMNSVLLQELERFNRLLTRVRSSLSDLQKAITGQVVMSMELEHMCDSMYSERVPDLWTAVAYPSLKGLGSWVADLHARLQMFQTWLDEGPPGVYWISGFFFTQSFLTGTLQNFARASRTPIDQILFDFEVVPHVDTTQESPVRGCYIHGLFLEGARWDRLANALEEPAKRQLFDPMPVIWLKPTPVGSQNSSGTMYACPVYKTSKRAGVLSTTGRSTNFILAINLPCSRETTGAHWVKRGVSLLTQLDSD